MSNRLQKLSKFGLTACLFLAFLGLAGPLACLADRSSDLDTRLREQLGEGQFEPSGRPRESFLVVLVDITQDGAVARNTGMELILGQPKTNSTAADLIIESSANGDVVANYRVADPRFSKTEDRQWRVADSTEMRVFVPLSFSIDLVSIKPVPGRDSVVSAGGVFDPRPLMKTACEGVSDADLEILFSECNAVIGLMVP
jgi:hypothetical protein